MSTYESVQRVIDNRFLKAKKLVDDLAQNNTGTPEDVRLFFEAVQDMHFAAGALKEQTRVKSTLAKSIIDAIQ